MSTSSQTYKDLAIPHFKEVFDVVDRVMHKLGMPYYLIGATAIALELLKKGSKPFRGTRDIDFAIMVSSIEGYEHLTQELLAVGFCKHKAPWTFYWETNRAVIDFLPFGEIEQNEIVQFHKRYSDLHVLGLKEVLASPEEIPIEE